MEEIEVKILEINREKVDRKLLTLGATKVFDDEILTSFLDFKDNSIDSKKDVLRLREQRGKVELTYKKVHTYRGVKQAEEISVQVSDLDATILLLNNLGLRITHQMEKHRTSYVLGSTRFDIDRYRAEYEFIPVFLEIEGSINDIKKYVMELGYQEKDCLPWSTDKLISYYTEKREKK
jgi:adenylate cyclase class 2